jgi:spore coat protein U-like protein
MNWPRSHLLLAVGIALWGSSAASRAETASVALRVTASVAANCKISVSDLSFGAYDPLVTHAGSSLDASAALMITCTRGTSASVLMDGGLNGGTGGAARQMSSGLQKLSYLIYIDSSRSTVWSPGGRLGVSVRSAGSPERFEVYGRIPPGQVVLAGSYSDRVTATVEF